MKIYILLVLSVLLCQCTGTSTRSGDNKQNPSNDANSPFWAARGKRNEGGYNYGIIRCGWMRSPEETDEEFNWPRLDTFEPFPENPSFESRYKRNVFSGYQIRDPTMDIPSAPLPSWWSRPSSHGNADILHRELAWLKLLGGKRNVEKDALANNGGGNVNPDSTSVPFWAARG